MIAGDQKIVDREKINLQHTKELCEAIAKPAFFMEFADAKEDDWFLSEIEDWDEFVSLEIPSHQTKYLMEHQEAYTLQRDVNRRYQQPNRIRAFGLNEKFRSHFLPYIFSRVANSFSSEDLDPNAVNQTLETVE